MTFLFSVIALGLLGFGLGAGLGVAARKFAVNRDERLQMLIEVLPGANCGGCGYPGCQAFAAALVSGKCGITGCPAGGPDIHSRMADIMGVEHEKTLPMVAFLRCRGGNKAAPDKFEYSGIRKCSAAVLIAGGNKACSYGCLGFGDCVRACPFKAISMGGDGIPVIDEDSCTACGLCVKACPRNIIELIPRDQEVCVACASPDKGKKVREVCSAGCIACGICVKLSPEGAVEMRGNLPLIKVKSARGLEKAVEKCPVKVLVGRGSAG